MTKTSRTMRFRAEAPAREMAIIIKGKGGADPPPSVVASNAHGTSEALTATANHAHERRPVGAFFSVSTERSYRTISGVAPAWAGRLVQRPIAVSNAAVLLC